MPYNFTLPRDDDYITKGFQEGVQLGVRGSALALERRRMDQDEAYRRALLQERALERQQEQEQLRALSELSSSFPMGVGGAQQAQTYDEAIREFSTPSAPSASPSDIVVQQNEWMATNAPKFLALKGGPQVLSALGAISDNYRQTISAFRTNIANVKVAQDNYNLIEKYKVDTPETRALHNQDKSIQRIQEFFTKNNIPFQELPDDVIRPDGFIDELKFHNWMTRVQTGSVNERMSPGLIATKELIKAQQDLDDAKESGDPSVIARAEQTLQLLKDAFPARGNEEFTVRTNPDGTQVIQMTKGGKSGGLGPTIGAETELQKNIAAARRTAEDLASLQGQLRPEDVGIRGAIGEQLVDRVVAQFAPEMQNDKRTENRTKLRAAIEGMVRRVNSDPRFSNADRKAAGEVLPSAGWQDSHPRIVKSLQTLQGIFARRTVADAKAAKMPIEPWMATPLSDEDIITLNRDGIITREEAIQMYNIKNPPQ